ncbi:SDR family oxidoreductase [Streptomyces sp. NPDC029041]|uniref:SDR family oxidoreductase n=1 Tax=Streptomyces sp. NPDC029041 TaxID=3155727 RepID=UPI0033C40A13
MKAVVHRGARTPGTEIESRVAEAQAPAKEWGGRGIDVTVIAPGCIATDNTEALRADPRRIRAILARVPAGRRRRPDDLAGVAGWLGR